MIIKYLSQIVFNIAFRCGIAELYLFKSTNSQIILKNLKTTFGKKLIKLHLEIQYV